MALTNKRVLVSVLALALTASQVGFAEKGRDFEKSAAREAIEMTRKLESESQKFKLSGPELKESSSIRAAAERLEKGVDAEGKELSPQARETLRKTLASRQEALKRQILEVSLKGNPNAQQEFISITSGATKEASSAPLSMGESTVKGASSFESAADQLLRVGGNTIEKQMKAGLEAEKKRIDSSASPAQEGKEAASTIARVAQLLEKTTALNIQKAAEQSKTASGEPTHGGAELAKTGRGTATEKVPGSEKKKAIANTLKFGGKHTKDMLESYLSNNGEPFEAPVEQGMDTLQNLYDAVKLSAAEIAEAKKGAKTVEEQELRIHLAKARRVREILMGKRENPLTKETKALLNEEEVEGLCGHDPKNKASADRAAKAMKDSGGKPQFCPNGIACALAL